MYEWNKPFQLAMKIKHDYESKFGQDTLNFETWLEKLNNKEYNDVFECLQTNQDNNFLLIRYGLAEMQEGMWTDKDSIYRECRSLVIDLKKEQIVLAPFRKFFNLNEVEENSLENVEKELKIAKSIEITNKLDGSMQSATMYDGVIFMAGSMALNATNSWRLADGYSKLTENHKKMIKANPEYTFIFEYISIADAHVVLYKREEEGLYLLKIRNTYTGEQLSYKRTKEFADYYNVPMTKIEDRSLEEIMELSKIYKSSEKEGWVLDIDGHMVKFKCDDYIKLHKLLDKLSSVNVIIQNIADGKYDDMMAKIPDTYKNRIDKIAKIIISYKETTEKLVEDGYSKAPKYIKKDFMIWVTNNCEKRVQGYIRCKYLGIKFNVLTNTSGGYKKLKDLGLYENYSALFADLEE